MRINKLAIILLVILLLLFSGCKQQTSDIQEQQATSNTQESEYHDLAAEDPEVVEEYNPLMSILETVIAKLPEGAVERDDNRGLILDFNEDGNDELILTYGSINEKEQRLEVWTTQDGKPRLLWEETLFESAGDPVGGIRMVTKDQMTYLCIYSTNSGALGFENFQSLGNLDFYSPTYQTEKGLYCQHWLSYDFFGPDNRTPAPAESEPESRLVFDGTRCDIEMFQSWMAAFDEAGTSLLQVGGALNEPIGLSFPELSSALSSKTK